MSGAVNVKSHTRGWPRKRKFDIKAIRAVVKKGPGKRKSSIKAKRTGPKKVKITSGIKRMMKKYNIM